MHNDIYISASIRDFEVVSKIKSILHSAGYTYYDDRQSFQPASDFEQTTRAKIISSKVFLCILSENSSSSLVVREDLRHALKENKIVIPLIIDDAELVNLGEIGHLLLKIPVIHLNPNDKESAKVILLHEIEKRCKTKPPKDASIIENIQYDVFISCKSDDYPFARKVYQYLKGQNYKVFLADAELRKKGNAEYGKIIDDALDSATHMIIIASKPEYINSSYVQSEWRTFIEEKRTGRKTGNIVTITEKLQISSLPIGLRQFESFDFKHYSDICSYLPIKDQKENINLGKQEITDSNSNIQRDLSKHKGCLITITIAFLLCVVYMLNYYTESSNIYSLTTNGVFGGSEANYIIIFDCRDDYDIIIEAKIQNPKNNNLTFFSMYLNKKHIEGVVNNENGKNIGYIDAELSISENFFEIKGESHIQENGDYKYKTIPIKVNGVLPTHIIDKIIQSNSTYFE